MRTTVLPDVAIVSGSGVGGGNLVYACTLYWPQRRFYDKPQRADLADDWEPQLTPHFATAERMLAVTTCDEGDDAARISGALG